jgi:hypothetical protein
MTAFQIQTIEPACQVRKAPLEGPRGPSASAGHRRRNRQFAIPGQCLRRSVPGRAWRNAHRSREEDAASDQRSLPTHSALALVRSRRTGTPRSPPRQVASLLDETLCEDGYGSLTQWVVRCSRICLHVCTLPRPSPATPAASPSRRLIPCSKSGPGAPEVAPFGTSRQK